MALPFLQADYGAFDTKFLGICLRFHSDAPAAFGNLLTLITAKSPAQANLDPRSLQDLAVASALDHEFRHLHDFVLSTHGNKLFRLRLAAIFHGMQSITTDVRKLPVPTPLLRWARMTTDERNSQEALWQRQVLPLDGLDASVLDLAAKNYAQVRACLVAESEIQPVDLYEASAVLVQVFAIAKMAGEQSALLFLNAILNGGAPARYIRVLGLLRDLWRRCGRESDLEEWAAVVSWSLLGTFGKRPSDDPPTRRFLRLLVLFSRIGVSNFDRDLRELFAEWDLALGYVSIEEAMRENAAANEELAAMFEQVPSDYGDKLFRVVLESCCLGIKTLIAANKAMAALYVTKPESYIYPAAYINSDEKVGAPIRFDFLGAGYRSADLRGLGLEVDVEIPDAESGEDVALSASLHLAGPKAIDGHAATRVALHIMMCDYLISDVSRDDADFRLARQKLREIGVTTLELL